MSIVRKIAFRSSSGRGSDTEDDLLRSVDLTKLAWLAKSFFFVDHGSYNLERILADTRAIAEIAAPTFEEDKRLAWVENRLAGIAAELSRDATGNLVCRWGDGPPRLMLTAHVDTVFSNSTPLHATVDGDRLSGPGVGDNAAAIAVVIAVVQRLHARGMPLADGAVVFTVGEEGMGNLRGARAALDALRPLAMIAVEGHGLDQIVVDVIGSVRSRIEIAGNGGHSWVDRDTPSAVHEALRVGQALLDTSSQTSPVNVGVIDGGRSVNTIAELAELSVEIRSTDPEALASFELTLQSLREASVLDVRLLEVAHRPAGVLDRSEPLLGVVEQARREFDLPIELSSGSTDANAAFERGIPALSIGVAHGRKMHTIEEEISISSLSRGTQQLERIVELILQTCERQVKV